jgi:hypothetical protein
MSVSNLKTEQLFEAIQLDMALLSSGAWQPDPHSVDDTITVLNEIQRRFTVLAQVEPRRFAIELDGGLVQQVYSDGSGTPKAIFAVIDYDVESLGDDDITHITQSDGSTVDAYVNFPSVYESGSVDFKEIFPTST